MEILPECEAFSKLSSHSMYVMLYCVTAILYLTQLPHIPDIFANFIRQFHVASWALQYVNMFFVKDYDHPQNNVVF